MKTICDKCGAPIIEEDGKYLCSVCGKEYGDADRERREQAAEDVRYAEFYQNVSLERFRQIAERLAGAVGNTTRPEIAVQSDGSYCMQSETENSRYAAQNWLDVERFYQPFYQQRYGLIGITADGRLEPTMIEMEKFFRELQEQGVSDMKMKDILVAEYEYTSTSMSYPHEEIHLESKFLGLDMRGKVVIFNPFEVLGLDRERESDVKECGRVMQELRSWPPIARLRELGTPRASLCGITEDGKVVCTNDASMWMNPVRQWGDVEDVVELNCLYKPDHCWIALRKDGTLLSNVDPEKLVGYVDEGDVRQAETFSEVISKLSGIVQIQALKTYEEAALLYLTEKGELYQQNFRGTSHILPKLIAKNVAALYGLCYNDLEYIGANGHRYNGEGRKLSTVPLFHNIMTLDEEWVQAEENCRQRERDIEAARKRSVELNKQRNELENRKDQSKPL